MCVRRSGITWMTKDGLKKPNYFGSLTQASTVRIGNYEGEEVYAPFKALLPMVEPNDIVLGGWDISSLNMAEAMERAKVLDWTLQEQVAPLMRELVPLPGACMRARVAVACMHACPDRGQCLSYVMALHSACMHEQLWFVLLGRPVRRACVLDVNTVALHLGRPGSHCPGSMLMRGHCLPPRCMRHACSMPISLAVGGRCLYPC